MGVVRNSLGKVGCLHCEKMIDLEVDHYVLLGTYKNDHTMDEQYFHILCWRRYFEECARKKAQAVVHGMQEKMMPIAKQMIGKLKGEIDRRS